MRPPNLITLPFFYFNVRYGTLKKYETSIFLFKPSSKHSIIAGRALNLNENRLRSSTFPPTCHLYTNPQCSPPQLSSTHFSTNFTEYEIVRVQNVHLINFADTCVLYLPTFGVVMGKPNFSVILFYYRLNSVHRL